MKNLYIRNTVFFVLQSLILVMLGLFGLECSITSHCADLTSFLQTFLIVYLHKISDTEENCCNLLAQLQREGIPQLRGETFAVCQIDFWNRGDG